MAITLDEQGNMDAIAPDDGRAFTAAELSDYIGGGETDMVHLGRSGRIMIVDKNGLTANLPLNPHATKLYWEEGGDKTKVITGRVIICNTQGEEIV